LRLRKYELCLLRQQIFTGFMDVFDYENIHVTPPIPPGIRARVFADPPRRFD
jgi:hypothetical protein